MKRLARLPGLGPRSARRAALALLKRQDTLLDPLIRTLETCRAQVRRCSVCGNLDATDPCAICSDGGRDGTSLCVVEEVEDLWAVERAGFFHGRYHVLGGRLSALDGIGPDELRIGEMLARVQAEGVQEVVLGLGATVEGQTTAHYIAERLQGLGVAVTGFGRGVPVGGELNFLDEGTLAAAYRARRPVG
ncbi:recombination mediator RecR [Geminicoccus flavidas]|uniref:recombination mediator RecR n=1 Tax=Geminicoccus flavidas TaxID=2506407 RepID=UPI001359F2A5|nr:recombination mediator RecR [Geminicoccus flavidas]